MIPVNRLVTYVAIDDVDTDSRRLSVSARHEAVLMNGASVVLLDDRGWSASGPPDIWAATSVEGIAETARMVVGPDEPFGGRSHQEMETSHWASLAAVLQHQGVAVDALELGRLAHDVVLSEELLARIDHHTGTDVQG